MIDLEQMVVEVQQRFDAPPADVFALLHDVSRMAGLGPEHHTAAWTSPTSFMGINRIGDREWDVVCHVVADEPPTRFAFTVDVPDNPSSHWSYDLAPDGDGTLVTQRMQHGPGPSGVRDFCEAHPDKGERVVANRSAQLQENMELVLREAARLLAQG